MPTNAQLQQRINDLLAANTRLSRALTGIGNDLAMLWPALRAGRGDFQTWDEYWASREATTTPESEEAARISANIAENVRQCGACGKPLEFGQRGLCGICGPARRRSSCVTLMTGGDSPA